MQVPHTKTAVLVLGATLFLIASVASAQSWSAPPAGTTPPANNVSDIINISGTTQTKAGALGVNALTANGVTVTGTVSGQQYCIGASCITAWPAATGGTITGSGTATYVPKLTTATNIANSQIVDNGTNVGIANGSPQNKLHVTGNIGATGWVGAGCEAACETGSGYSISYANGTIVSTTHVQSPLFTDLDDANYYVNPNSITRLADLRPNVIYDPTNTAFYLQPHNISVVNDLRASILYDRDNTGYYVNPNSTSNFNNVVSGQYCIGASCITAWPTAGGTLSGTAGYLAKYTGATSAGNSIISDNGSLATVGGNLRVSGYLYTDQNYGHGLVGVYSSERYQGVFAMGDAYKLPANGQSTTGLYGIAWSYPSASTPQAKAGLSHQALFVANGVTQSAIGTGIWTLGTSYIPFIYDQQDTTYYLDPNGVSILNDIRPNIIYDRNNTGYYLQPHNVSVTNDLRANIFRDTADPTNYYLDPNSVSYLNDVRPHIIYDRDNTGYYLNPNSVSNVSYLYRSYGFNGVEYDANNTGYYVDPNATSVFNAVYGGAFYYNSDERLKKNIEPIADALAKIVALSGVSYNWKDAGRGTDKELGLIAQEVEAVAPELVTTDDNGYKAVDYARVVPLLVEAMKEQQEQIETLQQEVKALKSAR